MTNSIQALPDKNGLIRIYSQDYGDKGVKITVKDNGAGMDASSTDKVFNPFYTTKTQGEGTGLGLSISYGLVRRYGGNIEVNSELNKGSEFTITLLQEPILLEDEDMLIQQLEEIETL
jgi:two-component system NtrC family sensor kinase